MNKKLKKILRAFEGKKDELIPILQNTQQAFGYLPTAAMGHIAKFAKLPESRVYAVATFYAQFRFNPKGKEHIVVCRGTACHVNGGPRILEAIEKCLNIKDGQTTPDLKYSLQTVACIGACALSPCLIINKKVMAKLTPKKISELFLKDKKR